MAAVRDLDDIRVVHQRLAVVPFGGHDLAREISTSSAARPSAVRADALRLSRDLLADLLEQRVLQLADALLGPQHLLLVILQLFGDEALGVGQGLAADVIGRDGRQIALGDLDRVAEDPVVADLEGRDAGAGLFLGLQAGDESLSFAADGAQFVQFGVVAGCDDAPFAQRKGGALDDAVVHQCTDISQAGRLLLPTPLAGAFASRRAVPAGQGDDGESRVGPAGRGLRRWPCRCAH